MLQIIGWLGCLMLAIKLLEMAGNPTLRDERGEFKPPVMAGVFIGWAGVVIFAVWLFIQGSALNPA